MRRTAASIPRSLRALRGRVQTGGFYGRYTGLDAEMKYLDTVEAPGVIAAAGTFFSPSLNIIPQDDTQSGRTGRKITIKKIQIRGQLRLPATTVAASSGDKIRLIFLVDTQTNGANPTLGTITETTDVNTYINMANSSRFRVLMDKTWALNASAGGAPTATPSFGEVIRHWQWYKTCDIPIEYDNSAATGALTTQRSNNVIGIGYTLSGLITSGFTCRIRYSDL